MFRSVAIRHDVVLKRFRDKPRYTSNWAWQNVLAKEFGCSAAHIYHIVSGRLTNKPVIDAILDCWPIKRLQQRLTYERAYLTNLRVQARETKETIRLLEDELARRPITEVRQT